MNATHTLRPAGLTRHQHIAWRWFKEKKRRKTNTEILLLSFFFGLKKNNKNRIKKKPREKMDQQIVEFGTHGIIHITLECVRVCLV